MNKPYHIVVWDCLNEVFGTKWEVLEDDVSSCNYPTVGIGLRTMFNSKSLTLVLYMDWETGAIHCINTRCYLENKKQMKWTWIEELVLGGIDFDNIETFKAFLEYNKRRFDNE